MLLPDGNILGDKGHSAWIRLHVEHLLFDVVEQIVAATSPCCTLKIGEGEKTGNKSTALCKLYFSVPRQLTDDVTLTQNINLNYVSFNQQKLLTRDLFIIHTQILFYSFSNEVLQ